MTNPTPEQKAVALAEKHGAVHFDRSGEVEFPDIQSFVAMLAERDKQHTAPIPQQGSQLLVAAENKLARMKELVRRLECSHTGMSYGDSKRGEQSEYARGWGDCLAAFKREMETSDLADAQGGETVEKICQLRACDQSTGKEYFIRYGERAELQAEADRMNDKGHDCFVWPPASPPLQADADTLRQCAYPDSAGPSTPPRGETVGDGAARIWFMGFEMVLDPALAPDEMRFHKRTPT